MWNEKEAAAFLGRQLPDLFQSSIPECPLGFFFKIEILRFFNGHTYAKDMPAFEFSGSRIFFGNRISTVVSDTETIT
jgi:hypothetical protein